MRELGEATLVWKDLTKQGLKVVQLFEQDWLAIATLAQRAEHLHALLAPVLSPGVALSGEAGGEAEADSASATPCIA